MTGLGWITSSRRARLVLLALVLPALFWANLRFTQVAPGGEEFLSGWTAARLWVLQGVSPYDPEVAQAAGEWLYGALSLAPQDQARLNFIKPLPAAVVYVPFVPLPYPVARALWMTLTELSLPAVLFLALRFGDWRARPGWLLVLLLFPVLWFPGLDSILAGSSAPFEALLITVGLLSLLRKHHALSGAILALTALWPGSVLLLLAWVFIWGMRSRRWGLVLPLVAGMALLALGSWAVLPGWPQQWAWRWIEASAALDYQSAIGMTAALFGWARGWVGLGLGGLLVAYSAWEWFRAGGDAGRRLIWAAQLTITVTLLLVPHRDSTDHVLLLPALGLVCASLGERGGRAARLGFVLTLVPLFVVPWVLYALVGQGGGIRPGQLLFAPVLTLIGLWWIRWWTVRPPLPSVAGS